MKTYTITVNGTAYDVTVEETAGGAAPAPAAKAAPAAPAAAPAPAPAPAKAAGGAAGSVEINAPMPGKILDVKAQPGASVSRGDVVLILEAMKMENEIFTPVAGTVVSVHVKKGDSVNSDDLLISIG